MIDKTFVIRDNLILKRLDKYLENKLDINRSQIKKLIKNGDIKVNGKIQKAGYSLKNNDVITILYEDEFRLIPRDIDFDILYNDDYLAIISKPIGLIVHPGAGNNDYTLVNGLLSKFNKLSNPIDENRPGIVHRLDKDTSGLMIISKTDEAYYKLVDMFKNHQIDKHYLAIVHGYIDSDMIIDKPIGRDTNNRTKMKVTDINSKEAYTSFTILKNFKEYTLLDVNIKTGRTHQIRVHLSYINHPVVGDLVYGYKNKWKINTQLLHAYKLKFKHPITGENINIEDKFPSRFKDFLNKIKK